MKCLENVSIAGNMLTFSVTKNIDSQDRKISEQLRESIQIILSLDKTMKYQYLLK